MSKEFAAAMMSEIKGKKMSTPYDFINAAMQSEKVNAIAEKYAKNPKFVELMGQIQSAAKVDSENPEALAALSFPGLDKFVNAGKEKSHSECTGVNCGNALRHEPVPGNYSLQKNEDEDDGDGIFSIVSESVNNNRPEKAVSIPQGNFKPRSASEAGSLNGVPFD